MQVRRMISTPQSGKELFIHVEADESASDPRAASRAGASNYVYPERACDDGT
jgi:hypothetical protein